MNLKKKRTRRLARRTKATRARTPAETRHAITIPIRLDIEVYDWCLYVAALSGTAVETVCSVLLSGAIANRVRTQEGGT